MTLATRLFRMFSQVNGRSHRAVPRLDSLRLSAHDLADLNLPPAYLNRLDLDRVRNDY
jgi:hypothetical protein